VVRFHVSISLEDIGIFDGLAKMASNSVMKVSHAQVVGFSRYSTDFLYHQVKPFLAKLCIVIKFVVGFEKIFENL
jgi:hypothetical protein